MTIQREIDALAERRHDERCANGEKCPSRNWHIGNDYSKNAARDVVAGYEADIANMRQRYGLR